MSLILKLKLSPPTCCFKMYENICSTSNKMHFKIPNEMRLIPSANFIEYLLNAWYVPDLEFRVPGSAEPGLSCTICQFLTNWFCLRRWTSLVVQTVKNLPATQETWVQSLGWEDPLVKGKAIPTPVFWPGEFQGLLSPWGRKELDTTEQLWLSLTVVSSDSTKPLSTQTGCGGGGECT